MFRASPAGGGDRAAARGERAERASGGTLPKLGGDHGLSGAAPPRNIPVHWARRRATGGLGPGSRGWEGKFWKTVGVGIECSCDELGLLGGVDGCATCDDRG